MLEATKRIGQKYRKGVTKDCFIFDSWFSSKKLTGDVTDVGADLIGIVKENTKVLCKYNIQKITDYWPGGSYLVLRSKPMVPRGRPLIYIGYKYNARKVIYFIVTKNSGTTQVGIPYLFKYPDQFSNTSICPVARPLVMSKFFGAVNEVDSHKKPRQSDLSL